MFSYDPFRSQEPRILTADEFVQIHGATPLTYISGFDPERTLADFSCFPNLLLYTPTPV